MGWVLPTGHVDTDDKWSSEERAYDNVIIGSSAYNNWGVVSWSSFLELTHDSILCSKVAFWVSWDMTVDPQIDVDVYYDGAWNHLYQGTCARAEWVEKTLAEEKQITSVRFSLYNPYSYGVVRRIHEVKFYVPTPIITTEAAEVPVPVSNPAYCEFADGNGTINSAVNATERGFEIKHEVSGTLYNDIIHEMAGFVGETDWDIDMQWHGTIIKIEHEHGDFVQGAFTLELGAFPAFFYDKLFAGESYTYRAYAIIAGVTYYGEWVAFSLGVYTAEGGVHDDNTLPIDTSGLIPIESPFEPISVFQPPSEWVPEGMEAIAEEFPELVLPEFEFPEFTYPDFPPYNGSWLGWFYYRKPYTKKDLDELRKKCRIFQDNSVEYALVINHNARVMQQFLNSMTEYLGADEYNTFKSIIPAQHLNALAREELGVKDFKDIINNFINNSIDNANNVNNNFQLIRSGLSAYAYTEDEGFNDITVRTKQINDDNPDVVGLKKVIDNLNQEMANNYETINHNLQVLRAILF